MSVNVILSAPVEKVCLLRVKTRSEIRLCPLHGHLKGGLSVIRRSIFDESFAPYRHEFQFFCCCFFFYM